MNKKPTIPTPSYAQTIRATVKAACARWRKSGRFALPAALDPDDAAPFLRELRGTNPRAFTTFLKYLHTSEPAARHTALHAALCAAARHDVSAVGADCGSAAGWSGGVVGLSLGRDGSLRAPCVPFDGLDADPNQPDTATAFAAAAHHALRSHTTNSDADAAARRAVGKSIASLGNALVEARAAHAAALRTVEPLREGGRRGGKKHREKEREVRGGTPEMLRSAIMAAKITSLRGKCRLYWKTHKDCRWKWRTLYNYFLAHPATPPA